MILFCIRYIIYVNYNIYIYIYITYWLVGHTISDMQTKTWDDLICGELTHVGICHP